MASPPPGSRDADRAEEAVRAALCVLATLREIFFRKTSRKAAKMQREVRKDSHEGFPETGSGNEETSCFKLRLTSSRVRRYPGWIENIFPAVKATDMQSSTTIDVSGLPEQVVVDIQKLVATIREKLVEPKPVSPPAPLPRWEGTVLGRMERREIYDDGE